MRVKELEDVVPAVFSNEAEAEAAMLELQSLGYSDNDFGIMVPDPTHYHLLDKSLADTLKGIGTGGIVGVPVGVLAGMGIMTVLVPPLGFIGIGGALLYGGLQGALWGAYIGAQVGLAAEISHLNDIERRFEIPLKPNEILVVVVAGESAREVCSTLERHGARCFWESAA
jgi:hypothetical protein